jgi:hypothetical protein
MAIGLQTQTASAQVSPATATATANWNAFLNWLGHGQDPRLTAAGIGIGVGTGVASYFLTEKHGNPGVRPVTTLGAYGITTAGCIVAYPFIGTIVLNRPLTPREAYMGMADCIVPFVGSWFVNTYLPHTAWYDGLPEKAARHHHR